MGSSIRPVQINSLIKAMNILNLLSTAPNGMTLTEISDALHIPKSTLYGLLSTMLDYAFVDRYSKTGKYRIGLRIFKLGHIVSGYLDIFKVSGEYMQDLVRKFSSSVNVVYLDYDEVLCVNKIETLNAPHIEIESGEKFPIHASGVGKAMMAHLPEGRVDRLINKYGLYKYTKYTITDKRELKRQLFQIYKQGFAEDLGEQYENVHSIAVPIFDHAGNANYAIGVCSDINAVTPQIRDSIIYNVIHAAKAISYDMGYRNEKI